MEPGLLDHVIVAGLVLVQPVVGAWNHRRLKAAIAAGEPGVRLRFYRRGMVFEWLLAAAVVALWFGAGRTAAGLGLVPGAGTGLIGAVVGVVLAVLLVMQSRLLEGHADRVDSARRQIAPLRYFLPHSPEEDRGFFWLSVSAGICEEIVFRGFLIAYFAAYAGLWPGVALSTLAFGLAHAYQGPSGILKTGLAGGVAALLFVGTGWLLAPVLAHSGVDVGSGRVVRVVRTAEAS